jgi:hypothetical protein
MNKDGKTVLRKSLAEPVSLLENFRRRLEDNVNERNIV